jgi:hypothetical protein
MWPHLTFKNICIYIYKSVACELLFLLVYRRFRGVFGFKKVQKMTPDFAKMTPEKCLFSRGSFLAYPFETLYSKQFAGNAFCTPYAYVFPKIATVFWPKTLRDPIYKQI